MRVSWQIQLYEHLIGEDLKTTRATVISRSCKLPNLVFTCLFLTPSIAKANLLLGRTEDRSATTPRESLQVKDADSNIHRKKPWAHSAPYPERRVFIYGHASLLLSYRYQERLARYLSLFFKKVHHETKISELLFRDADPVCPAKNHGMMKHTSIPCPAQGPIARQLVLSRRRELTRAQLSSCSGTACSRGR